MADSTASILQLLESAVPEQSPKLHDLVDKEGLWFVLDDQAEEIVFKADSMAGKITIGRKCLLRLRAHAYAYVLSWRVLGDNVAAPHDAVGVLEQRGDLLRPANRLLTWAMARDLKCAYTAVGRPLSLEQIMAGGDADLPPDILDTIPSNQRILCDGVAKHAFAYILLHEIVHVELKDVRRTGPASIEQERQADRIAAEWMLESSGLQRRNRIGRLFGITVALMWLASLNVYLGPGDLHTHPPGYDRLGHILSQFINESDETEGQAVWSFVALLLFLHVDNRQLPYDASGFSGSFKDIAKYLIDIVSKA